MPSSILHIDASGRHDSSVSRQLGARIVDRLGGSVVHRDLITDRPAFVDEATIGSYFTPADARSDAQQALLAASDRVVGELQDADTIVIATPIYNFGVPAALKAWADQAARVGVTFKYTPDGPEGLLAGKRAIIVLTSGGTKVDSDIDFATPWLRFFLGFIGITDVTTIAADQLGAGDEDKLAAANAQIDALSIA